MRFQAIALSLCLSLCGLAADFTSRFPAESKIIFRVNAKKVLVDPFFLELMNEKFGGKDVFFDLIKTWVGLDLNKAENCWIDVFGKDQALIILRGEFDLEHISQTVINIDTAQMVRRPEIPLAFMLADDKKPGQFNLAAFIDKKTLAFGPPQFVDNYLAALKGQGKAIPAEVAKQIQPFEKSGNLLDGIFLEFGEKELKKSPWLKMVKQARFAIKSDEVKTEGVLRVRPEKAEMIPHLHALFTNAQSVYNLLDPEFRKLGGVKERLFLASESAPEEQDLKLSLTLPTGDVTNFIRAMIGNKNQQ